MNMNVQVLLQVVLASSISVPIAKSSAAVSYHMFWKTELKQNEIVIENFPIK